MIRVNAVFQDFLAGKGGFTGKLGFLRRSEDFLAGKAGFTGKAGILEEKLREPVEVARWLSICIT